MVFLQNDSLKLVVFFAVAALLAVAGINQLQKIYLHGSAIPSPTMGSTSPETGQGVFPNFMEAGIKTIFPGMPVLTAGADGDGSDSSRRTISVTGQGGVASQPDEVRVQMRVETESQSAAGAQGQNAEISQKVRAALAGAGVPEDKLSTTNYRVSPQQEYVEELRKYVKTGFVTVHSLEVKLSSINDAGKVVDAAVGAGALVDNIQFGLSDSKQSELSRSALSLAGRNALEQARVAAESLGVKIKGLVSASVGGGYTPYPVSYSKGVFAEAASAPTQISPGELTVTSTVSAVFEIE